MRGAHHSEWLQPPQYVHTHYMQRGLQWQLLRYLSA